MERADVVVVGAGVMGAATAYALARRGRDVLLLEQFRPGHTRGSSHGGSRIFRLAHRDLEWVERARAALEAWRRVEEETGRSLLELNGMVEMLLPDDEGSKPALLEAGIEWEELTRDDVQRRWGIVVPENLVPIFQPVAGIVLAERSWQTFLDGARAAGARFADETKVLALPDGDGPVETSAGPVETDAVIVTAGPWARRLLAGAGIELPVFETIQTVAYFGIEGGDALPAVVDWDPQRRRHAMYALPAPGVGLKVGAHGYGPPTDPAEQLGPDDQTAATITSWTGKFFPRANPEPLKVETCLYTSTDDDRFVLERHGRIVVGSPCSGHGFKFAPWVGERLADLAAG